MALSHHNQRDQRLAAESIRQQTLLESAATMGFVGKQISRQVLQTESEVDWEQIYRAIGELTEREQSIVSLKFFGQQSHEQIGGVLGIETGTVRVALSRALGKLRSKLQDHHHESQQNTVHSNFKSNTVTGREETQ